MAGFIKIPTEKQEVQFVNTKIKTEIFDEFQKKLKTDNIPMNVVLTAFCRQYAKGNYYLSENDILKWDGYKGDTRVLNTSINKVIYHQFKNKVKSEKYYVRHVLSAFIEDYTKNDLVMEIVRDDASDTK